MIVIYRITQDDLQSYSPFPCVEKLQLTVWTVARVTLSVSAVLVKSGYMKNIFSFHLCILVQFFLNTP